MPTKMKSDRCNTGKFKRLSYFDGMLLTEQDFMEEQVYFREKLKLHNRLHGAGVVWGLCLRKGCIKVDSEEITKVFIDAGVALDCAGNEIVVCQDFRIPLDEKIAELRKLGLLIKKKECNPPEFEGPKLYIGIKYCECESQPAEQYTSDCSQADLRPQYARVREGFSVIILTEDEYNGCVKPRSDQPAKSSDCGCPGLLSCSEDELIIWLGHIEDYDVINDPPNHAAVVIVNLDNTLSSTHFPDSGWAHKSWDLQKLAMLATVFKVYKKKEEWVDLSVLVGRSVTYFEKKFEEEMKLKPGTIYKPMEMDEVQVQEVLDRINTVIPWVKRDAKIKIDVVTDVNGKCIIFPLVR